MVVVKVVIVDDEKRCIVTFRRRFEEEEEEEEEETLAVAVVVVGLRVKQNVIRERKRVALCFFIICFRARAVAFWRARLCLCRGFCCKRYALVQSFDELTP